MYKLIVLTTLGTVFGLFGVTHVVLANDHDDRVGIHGCLSPPHGLTGWWPGDGNTDDIVGGRNAELHGMTSFGLAFVDQAFLIHGDGDFDGFGDFVSIPHDPALDFGTGDFTIDFWAFFSDPGSGEQVLIEKWIQSFSGPSSGWTFTKLEGNELGLFIDAGDGTGQGVVSEPLRLRAGTWMHIAATRRAGLLSIFVNGRRVASEFSPDGNANADSLSSIKFGHRGNPDDTPGSESDQQFYLSGGIDEVEIFVGRALTRSKIRAIYQAGRRGKCKPVVPDDSLLQIRDLNNPGDGLLTLDIVTGREWLDVTQSVNRSFNDLVGPGHDCNPTCTTGAFQGFTFATQADVAQLLTDAGIGLGDITFDISSELAQNILGFINLTGPTIVAGCPPSGQDTRVVGLAHVPPFNPISTVFATHITEGCPFQAQAQTGFGAFDASASSQEVGAWLYR